MAELRQSSTSAASAEAPKQMRQHLRNSTLCSSQNTQNAAFAAGSSGADCTATRLGVRATIECKSSAICLPIRTNLAQNIGKIPGNEKNVSREVIHHFSIRPAKRLKQAIEKP
jgi:hypothetical protein